jgi:hypothetical protein
MNEHDVQQMIEAAIENGYKKSDRGPNRGR